MYRSSGHLGGSLLRRLALGGNRVRRRALAATLRMAVLPMFEQHSQMGVAVYSSVLDVDTSPMAAKLRIALDILRTTDERQYRFVLRYIRQVVLWAGDHTAFDRFDGVHLASNYLMSAPPEQIAAALVHEAVHLRIAARGIPYHPRLRGRIERICTLAEASFLRRCGTDGSRWAGEAEAGLLDPWWTAEERRATLRRGFEKVGLPGYLSWFFRWR